MANRSSYNLFVKLVLSHNKPINSKSMVLRTVPTYREVAMVHNYVRKADLSKGYWNPKRQLGVTKHFLTDNEAIIIRNTEQ